MVCVFEVYVVDYLVKLFSCECFVYVLVWVKVCLVGGVGVVVFVWIM